jgi:hypothetical protein
MDFVSGRVVLDGWQGEIGPATVYVRLEDTGRVDAPARTVALQTLAGVALDDVPEEGIEFALEVPEEDPRWPWTQYTVSVLVDLDGDGQSSVGDYRSMRAYPVLTQGYGHRVDVHVRRIG